MYALGSPLPQIDARYSSGTAQNIGTAFSSKVRYEMVGTVSKNLLAAASFLRHTHFVGVFDITCTGE